jgi:lysyl-tRNA synthetase class 2
MTFIRYDDETRELEITFTSGKIYRYQNVPLELYIGLLNAESKGEFFSESIKDEFVCSEVRLKRQRRG